MSISSSTVTTTAGGDAAGGSGVGIGGAISIAVLNTDTAAQVGLGPKLTLGGDFSAKADHTGTVITKADGAASGRQCCSGDRAGLERRHGQRNRDYPEGDRCGRGRDLRRPSTP